MGVGWPDTDKLARPFSKLESAGRDSFKIAAASVTESPCASTTSLRQKLSTGTNSSSSLRSFRFAGLAIRRDY